MAKAKVRYKGFSDVREMTQKQLQQHGIKVDRDLVFSRENNFTMYIDLNDDLESIFRNDGTFTVSAVTDDGEVGEDIVTASAHLDDSEVVKTSKAGKGK